MKGWLGRRGRDGGDLKLENSFNVGLRNEEKLESLMKFVGKEWRVCLEFKWMELVGLVLIFFEFVEVEMVEWLGLRFMGKD